MTVTTQSSGGNTRRGTLYDVLELILDRGLVIDAFVRVSLVGIELLTIDARIVVASVDTYLRFAEACNRLDLTSNTKSETLPELVSDMTESGAQGKSKGALTGAAEAIGDTLQRAREKTGARSSSDDSGEENEGRSRSTSRGSSRTRAKSKGDEG
jgi:hypothetical protein